jgi:hypothetical protein
MQGAFPTDLIGGRLVELELQDAGEEIAGARSCQIPHAIWAIQYHDELR